MYVNKATLKDSRQRIEILKAKTTCATAGSSEPAFSAGSDSFTGSGAGSAAGVSS